MKTPLENKDYNTMLEPSDWRFSAAIFGLIQYLDYHELDYKLDDDGISYNSEVINEEKYLEFVEYKYGGELHHKTAESILVKNDINDAEIKLVNEKLSANTIMKKIIKVKFDGTNKQEILDIINTNRYEIIKETFRSKSNMYANYANTNQLFNKSQGYCRLLGYCIDVGKKGKSTGFNFTTSTFVGEDILEFDFIPFAFNGDRESFFINDNYTIQNIKNSNQTLNRKIALNLDEENKFRTARQVFFNAIIESSDFINRDVEVIAKDVDKDYFETLYIRKESIDVFKALKDEKVDYKSLCFSQKVTDKYYINIQKEVTEGILNNILQDKIIELLLKEKNRDYVVTHLIKINVLIKGDKSMKDRLKGAFACAKEVSKVLEANKLSSYKQKLTSSIIFKDYDRVCQILLQLSNYSGVEFRFVYDLYDNFEENKELAYTFVNALSKNSERNS